MRHGTMSDASAAEEPVAGTPADDALADDASTGNAPRQDATSPPLVSSSDFSGDIERMF